MRSKNDLPGHTRTCADGAATLTPRANLRPRWGIILSAPLTGSLIAAPAQAAFPMEYLSSAGPNTAVALIWWLLSLSIFVVVVILVLVTLGVLLKRSGWRRGQVAMEPVSHGTGDGMLWLYVGVGLTVVALVVSVGWTAASMARIYSPPTAPKVTIDVTAQQWWWNVEYQSDQPSRIFETANEIHIPVGEPVRIRLTTADVIHSFWIPALGGKTDTIPGQVNTMWLQADKAGVYRGQCSEYCGDQHSHMGLIVFADEPERFRAWWDDQLQAAAPAPPSLKDDQARFEAKCGACHTVRGTLAGGKLGPDLTHIMSRSSIAAATLPNTVAYLSGWIANPQTIKPGSKMPNLDLSGPDLKSIRNYVLTLE